jgi:hypothetical protein
LSQIYKSLVSGPVPPAVPTQFTADDATIGVSVGNNFNLFSRDTTEDNDNGIRTTTDPNGSDDHYTELTNRLFGTVSVTGAVTGNLITFALAGAAASYRFTFEVTGRDTTTGDAVGYSVFGSAKTDGATATIVATPFVDNDEDASLIGGSIDLVASGNSVILQPTGVAGQTITYKAVGTYVVV